MIDFVCTQTDVNFAAKDRFGETALDFSENEDYKEAQNLLEDHIKKHNQNAEKNLAQLVAMFDKKPKKK